MDEDPDAGPFLRLIQGIQGSIGRIPGSGPVSAAPLGLKNGFKDSSCGHGPPVLFPDPEPPGVNVEISEFTGIPDRIVVHPEPSLVKGGDQGPELAFWPSKDRGLEDPLFRGEEPGVPVGFP
jgi:hypothetical protein